MKIATWNVNSLRVRLGHVLAWLTSEQPDILALQETKLKDADFPVAEFAALGYSAVFSGQPTYNGVAILSRQPPQDAALEILDFADPQRRVLGATFGNLRLWNLYVPNGQSLESDKYQYKLGWLAALRAHVAAELKEHPRLLLVGDFNIAPEDRDVHDPAAWEGHVLCSPAERAALQELKNLGLTDLFRQFSQPEGSYSWYDYRSHAFRRKLGLRIDLMLASGVLAANCTAARIDIEPRGWERPSDHVPVVAVFEPG